MLPSSACGAAQPSAQDGTVARHQTVGCGWRSSRLACAQQQAAAASSAASGTAQPRAPAWLRCRHAVQVGAAKGKLPVHAQATSELPALQDSCILGGGRCERSRWLRRPGRAAAAPHGGGSAARGRWSAQKLTSMTRLACLGTRTKRPSSPHTGADCLSGQHAVAWCYW